MPFSSTDTQLRITNEKAISRITLSTGLVLDFSLYDGDLGTVSDQISLEGFVRESDAFVPDYGYAWRVVSGTAELSATDAPAILVRPREVGALVLGLIINDGDETSAEATQEITVDLPSVSGFIFDSEDEKTINLLY